MFPPGLYAFCSDLHQGDGSPRDGFYESARWFLTEIGSHPIDARPVLVGDIKDALCYGLEEIQAVPIYGEIDDELAARRAIYVRGNHCPAVEALKAALPAGFVICDRATIGHYYVCHGQEWDLLNGRWHSVGDAMTRLSAAAGHLSAGLEDWIAGVADKVRGTGRHGEEWRFIDSAFDHIRHWPGINGVICGHTHKARRLSDADGGKEYINLGTWRTDGFAILEIE